MNKKTAIKVIEIQIQKLDKFHEKKLYDLVWKTQTTQYIKQIFGESSEQFDYMSTAKVQSPYSPDPTKFLDSCIDSVKNVGVYKEPKKNILSSLSDSLIVLILTTIGIVSFALGKYTSDTQNIELKRDNKELIDSLSFFKSRNISNVEKHYTNGFNQKKDSISK